jgi:hypothetical protein
MYKNNLVRYFLSWKLNRPLIKRYIIYKGKGEVIHVVWGRGVGGRLCSVRFRGSFIEVIYFQIQKYNKYIYICHFCTKNQSLKGTDYQEKGFYCSS